MIGASKDLSARGWRAPVIAFGLAGLLTCLGFQRAWPAALLGIAVFLLFWIGDIGLRDQRAIVASGAGAFALLGHALSESGDIRFGNIAALGAASCALAGSLALSRLDRSASRGHWALLSLLLAAGLASGNAASAGNMGSFLEWIGLPRRVVESVMPPVRKAIHFSFYGGVGLAAWRMRNRKRHWPSVASSILLASCAGGSDEFRQAALASRTGQFSDVLIDSAGAFVFVAIAATAFEKSSA